MASDLISRKALLEYPIRRDYYDREHGNRHFINGIESVLEFAENLPSVDAEPVRHAYAVMVKRGIPLSNDSYTEPRCSRCNGRIDDISAPRCQWCGAWMDEA